MNASELTVGLEVAVVAGSGEYERSARRATKAQVVTTPSSGRVSVELLEDSKFGLGRAAKGERRSIKTVQAWMPWATFEVRMGNERAAEEVEQQEDDRREERLAKLQGRADQFAGEVDEAMAWGGLRHLDVEKFVRVPTKTLEKLLDRAEGK